MKRNTSQRKAIQEVFLQDDRPLGVKEILNIGRHEVDTLNQATVYRNLKILVQKGWLRKVYHPKLGILYERADKDHRHHFHCRSCDRLFEIPCCTLNEKAFTPPGFITEGHQVFLFGLCTSCNE